MKNEILGKLRRHPLAFEVLRKRAQLVVVLPKKYAGGVVVVPMAHGLTAACCLAIESLDQL